MMEKKVIFDSKKKFNVFSHGTTQRKFIKDEEITKTMKRKVHI